MYKLKSFNFPGECAKKKSFTILAQPPKETEDKIGQPVSYFIKLFYHNEISCFIIIDLFC